ncbi:hypothetical protein Slin15195_G028700 [Septoria linicola]|uniref:Uncharacterized protein n=1 Tax=Septoria linicola TaxID=215465 RepID=A0A9Q9AP71_9PEZI|nr:hypothetical protein Slin14017_G027740 [Septoria linicola]USW49551.1 hypothetical protein Slin15195_G028700 [Septoria linicola]
MQYSSFVLATWASMAAAQSGPMLRFSEYGNGDTTCNPDNLISPSINIPGTGDVGSSIQFPVGTSSIQYALLDGSEGGYKVELFTSNTCIGPAIDTFIPAVGEQGCKPPLGGGWACVRVTKA